jgi:DNA primase
VRDRDRDTARIREALDDPHGLCDALGLLVGDWKRQAGGVMILCPFDHDEKTPSCSVKRTRDGVLAHCFGCRQSADGLGLVAAAYRLNIRSDYAEVLDLSADIAGVSRPDRIEPYVAPPVRPMVRREVAVPAAAPEDGSVDAVAYALSEIAPSTRDAVTMDYLRSRGLARSIAQGWYALPAETATRDHIVAEVIERVGADAWVSAGMCDEKNTARWSYAWTGPRVLIPWRAPNGAVEAIQGRYIGDVPPKVSKYVFPRGRRPRWPFGAESLDDVGADTAIAIVEGAIDAVSFNLLARAASADVVALAVAGVDAWDARWLRLFARRPCVVAFDRDKAGSDASAEAYARLASVARRDERGPMVTVKRPSTGKDWNDVLRAKMEVA